MSETLEKLCLAKRSIHAISAPSVPYYEAFLTARRDQWSPNNPDGALVMLVAENKLVQEDLLAAMGESLVEANKSSALRSVFEELACYQDPRGRPQLRHAFADFLTATIMKGLCITKEQISISCGTGSALDLLCFITGDVGDGVLLPAPYYCGFDHYLQTRNHLVPFPVYLDLSNSGSISGSSRSSLTTKLDEAHAAAAAQGIRIASLLVSNPNNPTGMVYPASKVREMMEWAVSRGIHYISDEVYGNSIFDQSTEFVGAAVVAHELQSCYTPTGGAASCTCGPDELVHVLYGMSKDFGLSGLRVGCVYSNNSLVHKAFASCGYHTTASSHTQWLVEKLLTTASPKQPALACLEASQHRLAAEYTHLEALLQAAGVDHIRAAAEVFVWLDLRSALDDSTWEAEAILWKRMATEQRLFLSPGSAFHAPSPGFFRMCWAAMAPAALEPAVAALSSVLRRARSRASALHGCAAEMSDRAHVTSQMSCQVLTKVPGISCSSAASQEGRLDVLGACMA